VTRSETACRCWRLFNYKIDNLKLYGRNVQPGLNQCSSRSSGVTWANFFDNHTRRATALTADCNLTSCVRGMPVSITLPKFSCVKTKETTSDIRTAWSGNDVECCVFAPSWRNSLIRSCIYKSTHREVKCKKQFEIIIVLFNGLAGPL